MITLSKLRNDSLFYKVIETLRSVFRMIQTSVTNGSDPHGEDNQINTLIGLLWEVFWSSASMSVGFIGDLVVLSVSLQNTVAQIEMIVKLIQTYCLTIIAAQMGAFMANCQYFNNNVHQLSSLPLSPEKNLCRIPAGLSVTTVRLSRSLIWLTAGWSLIGRPIKRGLFACLLDLFCCRFRVGHRWIDGFFGIHYIGARKRNSARNVKLGCDVRTAKFGSRRSDSEAAMREPTSACVRRLVLVLSLATFDERATSFSLSPVVGLRAQVRTAGASDLLNMWRGECWFLNMINLIQRAYSKLSFT